MSVKTAQMRKSWEDYRWNKTMLVCASIGLITVLSASLLKTYSLGHLETDLRTLEVFYRYFESNHLQLVMLQYSQLYSIHEPAKSKEVTELASLISKKVIDGARRDHIENCRKAIGTNVDELLNQETLPEQQEFSSLDPLPTLTTIAYAAMDRSIATAKERIARRRIWFFVAYVLGSVLLLCGGFRRTSGRVSRSSFFAWLGGCALLGAWFVQGFFSEGWEARQFGIYGLLDRGAKLVEINRAYIQSMVLLSRLPDAPDLTVLKDHIANYSYTESAAVSTAFYSALPRAERDKLAGTFKELFDTSEDKMVLVVIHMNFQTDCVGRLEEEASRLASYQRTFKFVLVGLMLLGTVVVIRGRYVELKEGRPPLSQKSGNPER